MDGSSIRQRRHALLDAGHQDLAFNAEPVVGERLFDELRHLSVARHLDQLRIWKARQHLRTARNAAQGWPQIDEPKVE